ncbi:MAG: ATP-binding domain-containing protein [Eggerthellaceae bacterium]|nr:ATP-binding domain-containing protein [Eggerthellaceae bacterium]
MPTDEVFILEQEHLSTTYAKLEEIRDLLEARLDALAKEAGEDFAAFRDELFLGSADDDQRLEMHIEYEYLNHLMDQYNLTRDVNAERLSRALLLLKRPYFAKITVQFKPDAPARELYIGEAGMVDEYRRHFILDWRSPVAELYYNRENGRTSYVADGRTITCDLKLRRQFDIEKDTLKAYYDTTVAIQDELLLEALMRTHSDKMGAITMTIQREQNQVIRHPDVPALLVEGIAGSGKTSVLLQRIAYLFYTYRDTLDPSQVCLITPNPVFRAYIDNVLPQLGEANPRLVTKEELMARISRLDRAADAGISVAELRKLGDRAESCELDMDDFYELAVDDEVVVSIPQLRRLYKKLSSRLSGHGVFSLMVEELLEQTESRIKSRSREEEVHDELLGMSAEEQRRLFGQPLYPMSDEELIELSQQYLRDKYASVFERIVQADWLRIDRIGCRLAKVTGLSRVTWAYIKLRLTGFADRETRYVTIDEVQDYTASELLLLSEYFPHANFLMLGDRHQAISASSASFDEIREVFMLTRGSVDECFLATSYRSTPQITELFASLLDEESRISVQSVQRDEEVPVIIAFDDEKAYRDGLIAQVEAAYARKGSAAVITSSGRNARRIHALLAEQKIPVCLTDSASDLDLDGINVMSVKLAKGLEFDSVIIPDADAATYPDEQLAKNRLYTAISRATHNVAVLCCGKMTPLLKP